MIVMRFAKVSEFPTYSDATLGKSLAVAIEVHRSIGEKPAEAGGLAGTQGLEPRYATPEAAVLPLDDVPASVDDFHYIASTPLFSSVHPREFVDLLERAGVQLVDLLELDHRPVEIRILPFGAHCKG